MTLNIGFGLPEKSACVCVHDTRDEREWERRDGHKILWVFAQTHDISFSINMHPFESAFIIVNCSI